MDDREEYCANAECRDYLPLGGIPDGKGNEFCAACATNDMVNAYLALANYPIEPSVTERALHYMEVVGGTLDSQPHLAAILDPKVCAIEAALKERYQLEF